MSNTFKGEEVLCSIKSHKNIKKSNVIANFFTNLISQGVGGRVTNDFKLVLTPRNLYIEATTYVAWGGLPETLWTDKIAIQDIQHVEVKNENSEELITITVTNKQKMTFIRDNEKNDNLALEMARLISEKKEN